MATQFRLLGPEDAEELATHLVAWQRCDGVAPDAALIRREVCRVLADPERWHVWLIIAEDEAAGYLALSFRTGRRFEAPWAWLDGFYLRPERRASSLGRAARRFIQEVGIWLKIKVTVLDPAREDRHLASVTLRSAPAAWAEPHALPIAV